LAGELMTPKEVAKFVDMDKDFLFTFKSDTVAIPLRPLKMLNPSF
jgi:hypothetical protein